MSKFCVLFGDHQLGELTTDDVMEILNLVTKGCRPQTKHIHYAHLFAFFNFIQNNIDPDFTNPCDPPMLRKLFRPKVKVQWNILEKDRMDEIIFRTDIYRFVGAIGNLGRVKKTSVINV